MTVNWGPDHNASMGSVQHPASDPRLPRLVKSSARWFAIAAALLLVFAVNAALALVMRPVPTVDLIATRWVQRLDGPLPTAVLVAVTGIGYFVPWVVLTTALALGLWLLRRRVEAGCVLLTLVTPALTAGLKLLFRRHRPTDDLVAVLSQREDFGFPSGHAASFVCLLGLLMFLVSIRWPRSLRRTALLAVLAAPVALVGVSRLYLGHHWLSDVLAGYAVGGLWLLVVIGVYNVAAATWPPAAPFGIVRRTRRPVRRITSSS